MPYLDEDKIAEDEKFDGYYSIITSEVDMPDREAVKAYHELWKIENSFKITKSDLESRPVYVSLETRIEGHFLTCFISLLFLRLLSKKLDGKYVPEQLIKSLKKYKACFIKDNIYRQTYYDKVIKDIGEVLDMQLNKKFLKQADIRNLIAQTKK